MSEFQWNISPFVRHYSITKLLVIVGQFGLYLEQMNVKTAILDGEFEDKIFIK